MKCDGCGGKMHRGTITWDKCFAMFQPAIVWYCYECERAFVTYEDEGEDNDEN